MNYQIPGSILVDGLCISVERRPGQTYVLSSSKPPGKLWTLGNYSNLLETLLQLPISNPSPENIIGLFWRKSISPK